MNELCVFKTMAEFSANWLMWLTLDNSIKYISPAAEIITGYKPEEFIQFPDLLKNIIHPEDKIDILHKFENQMHSHRPFSMEFRIIHKDGDIRWIEHSCRPLMDDSNKIIGSIISNRNVTDNKIYRDKVLKMTRIIEQSSDAIAVTDTDGYIEYVNPAFELVTGYSYDKVKGKSPRVLKSGKHSAGFYRELWDTINRGDVWRGVFINKNKNGKKYYEDAVICPIRNDSGEIISYSKIARNITKQKEIEDSLKKHEQLLTTLINASPDIICLKDGQGRWQEANKADLKLFQLENVDYRGKKDSELAEYSDFYYDAFMACETSDEIAWQKGSLSRGIEIIPCPHKGDQVYDVIKVPLFKEDGSRKALVVLGHNITDLKEKENALLKSERKYKKIVHLYRLIADNIPDLVWAKDLNGNFIFTNKTDCEVLLGAKDVNEPIGKNDMFFARRHRAQHPNRKNWFTFGELCMDSDSIVIKKKKPQRFDEYGYVQGKFLYLDVFKAPFFDENGEMIGTVGSGRIVNREKELEKKLIESEQRYRKIFEESLHGLFVSTVDGHIIDINPAGLNIFGYSSLEEIQKIDITRELYKYPEQRGQYIRQIQEKGFVKDYESHIKKKDGSEIIVLETSTAVYDENKNFVGLRGIMRDVTEKRVLEQQLMQVQRMESIGTLAGGVAHDFNNILTIINGYSELLLMQIDKENPIYHKIDGIYKAGERAQKLTGQLLAFSRKQVFKPQIMNINHCISSINKMLKRLITEDINMEIILKENLPHIKADMSQLEQILINLVVNARDSFQEVVRPDFHKKITIETGQVFLDDSYVKKHYVSKKGDYVFLAVSDNGTGMDDETKQRVFEPFFTTKDKTKGTGLGLSTVYGIVKQNNASIYIYSELDIGTMFKIYWPVCDEKKHYKKTVSKGKTYYSGNESVLIVEDNKQVLDVASTVLKSLGYTVYQASNGKEALEDIKSGKYKFDIVITDLVMPVLNGKEFIFRAKKIIPSLKVIYTSGYTDNHIVHNGMLEDGINFIQKPYSIEDLAKTIRKILEEE